MNQKNNWRARSHFMNMHSRHSGGGLPRMLLALVSSCLLASSGAGQSAHSDPFGYVKFSVAAGTGTVKRTTLLSIPLIGTEGLTGHARGRITSVSPSSITSEGAGWAVGELSRSSAPFFIEITSGEASGRVFLISTEVPNTADTINIAAAEAVVTDLTQIGIKAGPGVGDSYQIWPVDTISSFFGVPSVNGIQGGATAREADTILLVTNGSSSTYFYNTAITPPGWVKVSLGLQRADHVPIPPHSGIQYGRIAPTPLEITAVGAVPTGKRQVPVKNSGTTLLSSYWPHSQTLSTFALQNTPGWRSGVSGRDADTVVLVNNGSASTFFHDGSHWRRVSPGTPVADGTVIPLGSSLLVSRKGTGSGYSIYANGAPYRFD